MQMPIKFDIKKYPGARCFSQHGTRFLGLSGKQLQGTCIFCGSDRFYLNPDAKKWDCKKCLKSGGYTTWLREVSAVSKKAFMGKPVLDLAKDRKIPKQALKRWEVGYNAVNGTYNFPIYSVDGSKITDLRIYKLGGKLRSTAGGILGIVGVHRIMEDEGRAIWLCEGEWDAMALDLVAPQCAVVAIPGASTFKADWTILFKDRVVRVGYDNDQAGRLGGGKVFNTISEIAQDLKFIHWPKETSEGYDIRDYVNSGGTLEGLQEMLQDMPVHLPGEAQGAAGGPAKPVKLSGKGLHYQEILRRYQRWLHMPDDGVLKAIFGSVIANRLPGEPLWLFLIAPPGGSKSELLMSLIDAPHITTTTSLTPHALVSGASFGGGGDPSLIPKLNNKVLVIKDFTTILNMHFTLREEIFGILRDAYDGKTEKFFGNGVFRSYNSKFGLIAGVTPAIEQIEGQTALGERFLRYRIQMGGDVHMGTQLIKRALSNVAQEDVMRKELRDTGREALDHEFKIIPEVPESIDNALLHLAQWVAVLRGSVMRERYTGQVNFKPSPEVGTRLAKQFRKMCLGVGMFLGKQVVGDSELQLVKKIARDTIPGRVEEVVAYTYLQDATRAWTSKDLSVPTRLPSSTCLRILQDLVMLGVMHREPDGYKLTKSMLDLMGPIDMYKRHSIKRRK